MENTDKFILAKKKLILSGNVPDTFALLNGDVYSWVWITCADAQKLLEIRNAPHVLEKMRNQTTISIDVHNNFLKNYLEMERVDFVCVHRASGNYVGGFNMSKTSYGYEIGKYIGDQKYLGQGLAVAMCNSFLEYVNVNLKFIDRVVAVTKITNHININLNFKIGFKIKKLIENEYWLMECQ